MNFAIVAGQLSGELLARRPSRMSLSVHIAPARSCGPVADAAVKGVPTGCVPPATLNPAAVHTPPHGTLARATEYTAICTNGPL